MRFKRLPLVALISSFCVAPAAMAADIDWSQPPLACVEDIVPSAPSRPCPNLTHIEEITKELTVFSTIEEQIYWTAPENKRALNYCRSVEILRREKAVPGSMTKGAVQISWMRATAVSRSAEKLKAIVDAGQRYRMPIHVLVGALTQESLLSDLGISDDGGNFSCGAGQVNLLEWCRWANKQSPTLKTQLGWPAQPVSCQDLDKEWVRPFQELALKNMGSQPSYQLNKEHFAGIRMADIRGKIPGATEAQFQSNYGLVKSFINHCTNPVLGIDAKAHELSQLFRLHISAGMQKREVYPTGKSFRQPHCRVQDHSGYYPLHTGWLMAVAAYNAGPRATDVVPFYYGWTSADMASTAKLASLDPARLVEGLYYGGSYNALSDRFEYKTLAGKDASNPAFKQCVMHQHVVRIAQHVTRSDVPSLLTTFNGSNGCRKETPVPNARASGAGRAR